MNIDQKTDFIQRGRVTWGQTMPDTCDNKIHIGVFGACRILLHGEYINPSLLKNLCDSVNTALFDDDDYFEHRVVWNTATLDLQHQLQIAVQSINDVWNSDDVHSLTRKITFVEHSLTLTNEDIKEQIKILSNLITPDGHNGFMAVRGRLASEPQLEPDSDYDEWGNY
jgi:hypothetical protein